MSDKLQEICAAKRVHVEKLKAQQSFSALNKVAHNSPPPRGFAASLQSKIAVGGVGLITEIKKASPSAGVIRPDFKPAVLASAYEAAGAACLSVLTDEPYFQGRNADLIAAREACNLPVLRKDFMLDVWQVAEARALGADCILLIMAALTDSEATALHAAAHDYGMDILIEVHDRAEMERALKLPSGLIGINNRNLKTLKIDLSTTEELAPMVPKNRTIVSESGITTPTDISRIRECGVHSFLVGESLLRQENIGHAVKNLLSSHLQN